MRSKRRTCATKVSHKSFGNAVMALKRLNNRELEAYQCPYCHKWHIGRSNKQYKKVDRIMQLLEQAGFYGPTR